MSISSSKAKAKVDALSASLDELSSQLEPLFAQPLSDTVAGLETVQQAKLYAVLPYIINDLIFVYLKTQGVDPKTHPVVGELERVRKYFEKIANAEEAGKKRTTAIDKEAAGRFIKHAIASVRFNPPADESPFADPLADPQGSKDAATRVTEKMRAREAYLRQVADEGDKDEDVELVVFDEDGNEDEGGEKGREGEEDDDVVMIERPAAAEVSKKKKRPLPMDPFASMGDKPSSTPESSPSKPKKKKKRKEGNGASISSPIDVDSLDSSRPGTPTGEKSTKKKKKKSALSQA